MTVAYIWRTKESGLQTIWKLNGLNPIGVNLAIENLTFLWKIPETKSGSPRYLGFTIGDTEYSNV